MLKKATKIMCWFACVYILICGNEKEIFAQVERQYVTATIENTWPDKYPYVAKLKVYLDSKYEIEKVYDSGSSGVYGSVEVGDLTGDGQNEVVVNLSWIGSTYAATDTYVYMIEDEKLVEVLHLDGDNISQFDSMFQTCAGAKIQDGNLCISGIIDKYDNFDSVVIGCKDGIWEVIDSENEKELKTNAESNNNKKVISTKVVDLEDSKTYKQYDITGDGKADTLKIKKKAVYHMSGDLYDWKIMVNGKKVFEVDAKEEKNISVKLYSVSKNRTYLYIREGHVWFHEMIDCGLYQYKKGKLKKVVDLYGDVKKCVASYEISIEIEKMTKNKITVIYSDQLNATGRIDWKVTYVRKKENGKGKVQLVKQQNLIKFGQPIGR